MLNFQAIFIGLLFLSYIILPCTAIPPKELVDALQSVQQELYMAVKNSDTASSMQVTLELAQDLITQSQHSFNSLITDVCNYISVRIDSSTGSFSTIIAHLVRMQNFFLTSHIHALFSVTFLTEMLTQVRLNTSDTTNISHIADCVLMRCSVLANSLQNLVQKSDEQTISKASLLTSIPSEPLYAASAAAGTIAIMKIIPKKILYSLLALLGGTFIFWQAGKFVEHNKISPDSDDNSSAKVFAEQKVSLNEILKILKNLEAKQKKAEQQYKRETIKEKESRHIFMQKIESYNNVLQEQVNLCKTNTQRDKNKLKKWLAKEDQRKIDQHAQLENKVDAYMKEIKNFFVKICNLFSRQQSASAEEEREHIDQELQHIRMQINERESKEGTNSLIQSGLTFASGAVGAALSNYLPNIFQKEKTPEQRIILVHNQQSLPKLTY